MAKWRTLGNHNGMKGWQPLPRSRWIVKKENGLSEGQFLTWELLLTLAVWDYRKIDWLEVRESYTEIGKILGKDKSNISRDIKKLREVGLIIDFNGRIIPVGALSMACHTPKKRKLFMEAYRCATATNRAQNDNSLYLDFEASVALVQQSVALLQRIRAYMRDFSLGFSLKVNYVSNVISVNNVNSVTNINNLTNIEDGLGTDRHEMEADRANKRLFGTENKEWLKNIPDEDLDNFAKLYEIDGDEVMTEGEKAYDWLEANGKTQKNHQAFLSNWLRRGQQHEWLKDRF